MAADDTGVLYGSNVYNSIIYSRFDENKVKDFNSSTVTEEIVDIVSGYPWTIDPVLTSSKGGTIDVPHCYVIEYQQRYSSTITNLINSFSAAKSGVINTSEQIGDLVSKVSSLVKNLSSVGSSIMGGGGSSDSGGDSSGGTEPTPAPATPAASGDGGTGGTEGTQTPAGGTQTAAEGAESSTPAEGTQNQTPAATPTPADTSASSSSSSTPASQPVEGGGVNKTITDMTNDLKEFYEKHIGSKIANISNPIKDQTNKGKKHFMQPYSLLYDLKATGTRYCFPMVSEPPVIKTHNSYGDGQGDDSSILSVNSLFSNIGKLGEAIPAFGRDLGQINSFLSGTGGGGELFERTHVEKAKFFQFPSDTDTYSISFPLINTVTKNGVPTWQNNYKFIMLFSMKNMIFRKDNVAFYPPLFYDLVIPGTIRLPYSYVESIDVQPLGMVRILKADKIFEFTNDGVSVPVPDAWMVTIKFKSLIATSGNLVLSAFSDLPIVAESE